MTRPLCVIGANPRVHQQLSPALREHRVRAAATIKRQGDPVAHLIVLKLGSVYISHRDEAGQERPVAMAGRGFLMGTSALVGHHSLVSIIAAEHARLCAVPHGAAAAAAQEDPELRRLLMGRIAANYALLARWNQVINRSSVVAQVAAAVGLLHELQGLTRFNLPAHRELSRMLGTTRESVARALATLEEAGCLVRESSKRCEVDPQRLQQWSRRADRTAGPAGA